LTHSTLDMHEGSRKIEVKNKIQFSRILDGG